MGGLRQYKVRVHRYAGVKAPVVRHSGVLPILVAIFTNDGSHGY